MYNTYIYIYIYIYISHIEYILTIIISANVKSFSTKFPAFLLLSRETLEHFVCVCVFYN